MKILIAPDSFKDCLSAHEVAQAIKSGIERELPFSEIITLPMADGGEGTVHALINTTGGEIILANVTDPLGRKIKSFFGLLENGKTAVIELAAASGLELLLPKERNPWLTTSYGTGELILQALDKGCKKIIIGIGGSATNDAGVGMAQALGIRFINKEGGLIGPGGGALGEIVSIDRSYLDTRLKACEIIVACDVTNPFTGPQGASEEFGPQKGANAEMVQKLDQNFKHLARLIKDQLNIDIQTIKGSGAAGGIGGGLFAFLNADIQPGFEIVRKMTSLDEHISGADLVITGEGRIDSQTCLGKTPYGVAQVSAIYQKPVLAIAGTLGEGYEVLYGKGFSSIVSIIDNTMKLEEALEAAPALIESCARSAIRLWAHKI